MEHRRSAVEKETLNHIQRGWAQFLEYSESKSLSDGRLDAVEDCICARAFHPFGTAVREEATPCFRVLDTRVPFGALQTFRECKVRKVHRVRLCIRLGVVAKRTRCFEAVEIAARGVRNGLGVIFPENPQFADAQKIAS